MFFLFGSVLFGILLRKLNNIERSSGSVNYRTFPSYSFNEDMPYRLPRRSIDVNFRGIDTSTPTRTSTPPPGDEDLARGIARSLGGEYGTRHFTSQGARGARGGGGARGPGMAHVEGGQGVALGQPGYVGGIHGIRGSVEPYVNYENFSGAPLI